ncbi:lycopene cyclase domain-containing protein [Maribellus maritimus]|uniref:lycopene cyclase domain-containing protein n=1 Tax=Maribellus maritimus TaxID=2870838 RepID=UPI001EEA0693|nr:lycopene cyclase domain-containing protein [Maribellus maritimus]MCG6189194.1 lycopene cyclase domain-containing protein [Maribellus maritimus]
MSLYFVLLLASVGIPLLLSFDKRLRFYKQWKTVFPSLTIVAIIYIIFDIIFTDKGIWGFNPRYLSGITIVNLPMEEILFFFAIPYASLFLHYSFVEYFPNVKLNRKLTQLTTLGFLFFSFVLAFTNIERAYTFYIFLKMLLALLFSLILKTKVTQNFFVTFLLILVPFVVVNGVLTGTWINQPIVWYNDVENLGIRILTIPIEDFAYAFSMLLFNLLLIELFRKKQIL